MAQYIDKDVVVAEIENLLKPVKQRLERDKNDPWDSDIAVYKFGKQLTKNIDTLEVKEVDVWKTVDNINPPQADRNKIYCVLSKNKYLLARVINNPQDEDLLQWKCTEFPFHRYDMCEGDKYMQIV